MASSERERAICVSSNVRGFSVASSERERAFFVASSERERAFFVASSERERETSLRGVYVCCICGNAKYSGKDSDGQLELLYHAN